MMNLVPTEAWDYRIKDLFRGLSAALSVKDSDQTLGLPSLGHCIPTRSARTGIIIAIKALNLKPGARIGVPLHCCPVVFKVIQAAHCTPIFIDVDPKTFCISTDRLAAKSSQIDALIAVHMFGHTCDMPTVQEVMKDKPVIEDCAQSLGSSINGRQTGSFSTVAAFSFRLGKYLSAGEGGALLSKDPDIQLRMIQLAAALPSYGRLEESKHVFVNFIRAKLRSRPLWGLAGQAIWSLYNKKVDFVAKSPIVLSQVYHSDLTIVRKRLALLDSMIKTQRANADYYLHNLHLDPSMLCFERPGTIYNRFMFPIIFRSSEDRDEMAAYLEDRQISSSKPYEEAIKGAAEHYGYGGDCPTAEQLLRRTLVVPNNYLLKKRDLDRILQSVNDGWAKIMSRSQKA